MCSTLAAGSHCTITVTFTPGNVRTSSAKVAVNDDSNNDCRQNIYLALANGRPGSAHREDWSFQQRCRRQTTFTVSSL